MLTEIFQFVDFCVSVTIMGESMIWCLEVWLSRWKHET